MTHAPVPLRPADRFAAESFEDLLAQQLQHAPWLGVSIAAHVVVFGALYLFVPAARRAESETHVELQIPHDDAKKPEAPPPPPPKALPEPTPTDVVLQDSALPPSENPAQGNGDLADGFDAVGDATGKESAFDSNQWNSAVGMGGGAGGKYGGRGKRGGGGLGGGGKATAQAIDSALAWLQQHQDEDGKWDCDQFMKHDSQGAPCDGPGTGTHDVGVTGLALLAFLGDGSTLRSGAYQDNIKRGVRWLKAQQQDNGLFGSNASSDFVYDHAIAAYAMCEAYGLSNASLLKKVAQNGISYLETHRNPYSVWRYQPRDNDNDSSVTGWCVMAYESAKFFKLDVNDSALKLAATWFDGVTDVSGRTGYTQAGEPSSRHPGDHLTRFPAEKGEAMTAVALFCRFFMGQNPSEHPAMRLGADLVLRKPPVWDAKSGGIDFYYWYYGTYALYQMGEHWWKDWEKRLKPAVVDTQRKDGNFRGSWDPCDVWGEDGGRVYSTALLALTLEAYYRYTKLVR